MRSFPIGQQDIAARTFHYLVTPSGGKIAYTAPDLAGQAQVEETALEAVLDQLTSPEIRILRRIDPPPYDPESPRYESFTMSWERPSWIGVLDTRPPKAGLRADPGVWIEVISSGRKYAVANAIISLGRSTDWWRHDINLRAQPVSGSIYWFLKLLRQSTSAPRSEQPSIVNSLRTATLGRWRAGM